MIVCRSFWIFYIYIHVILKAIFFFLSNIYTSISFSCSLVLEMTSPIMLNRVEMVIVDILSLSQTQGERRHSIFNINYELSCAFFIYALYQVKDAPFYSQFPMSTSYEYGLNFIKCFFLYLLQWHFFSLLMRWIKLFFLLFFF